MSAAFQPLVRAGENGNFRLPDDGFVMLMPLGEFPGEVRFGAEKPEGVEGAMQDETGRWFLPIVQVIDAESVAACAASHRPDTLIDFEHNANRPDGETRAAGWTEAVEARPDGLWAKIRWSADGIADVTGGNYRYLSPVFPWSTMEHLGGARYRARSFDGAALTNTPNLRTIKAVSNSARAANANPNRDDLGRFAEAPGGADRDPKLRRKISDFVEESLRSGNEQRLLKLGSVTAPGAERIRKATGLDVTGYEHAVDNYAVRHLLKHGDPAKELPRGQLPITASDIARLPEITESPDDVFFAGKTKQGRDGIGCRKSFSDGTTYLVEEVRTGRKRLVPVTMRKTRNRATSDGGFAPNSYVRNASPAFLADADKIADHVDHSNTRSVAVNREPRTPLSPRVGNAGTAPELAERKQEKDHMNEKLIQALGLPPEATEDDVLQAVGDMKKRLDELEAEKAEALVENDLKALGDRVENRAALKEALLRDREGTLKVINAIKAPKAVALNARAAHTPDIDFSKAGADLAQEQERAVEEYRIKNKCSRKEAWNAVRRERPELFITQKEN